MKCYISCNTNFIVLEHVLSFCIGLTSKWHNISIADRIPLVLLWHEAIYHV